MAKVHEPGTYFFVVWEDGDPEYEAVYGHVDAATFRRVVRAESIYGELEGPEWLDRMLAGEPVHAYARMAFAPRYEFERQGIPQPLQVEIFREPLRGRFPVTLSTMPE